MEIICPSCGEKCVVEEEPAVGRRLLCPFCGVKFNYAPQGASANPVREANASKGGDAPGNAVGKTMRIACPYCGADYEVDAGCEGEIATCGTCDRKFVMQAVKKADPLRLPRLQKASSAKAPEAVGDGRDGKFIECKCPRCGSVYEIAEAKVGATEVCDECGASFVVTKREKPNAAPKRDSQPMLKPVAKLTSNKTALLNRYLKHRRKLLDAEERSRGWPIVNCVFLAVVTLILAAIKMFPRLFLYIVNDDIVKSAADLVMIQWWLDTFWRLSFAVFVFSVKRHMQAKYMTEDIQS